MRKLFKLVVFISLLAALIALPAIAQEEAPKPVKLFKDHATMQVTLKGPWRTMVRRKTSEKRHEGQLEFTDSNGDRQTLDIELTTRGLTRLERVCDFPPLKIWFDKEQVKGTAFRGQSSLKMVTHCKTSRAYQNYYAIEYLSYRIYNLITEYSFKVRPMQVSYVDTERDSKPLERFGFLIEDIDDVADRHDIVELEIPRVKHTRLDPEETANYSVFQYMIANLDWSATGGRDPVECCHNTKLIAASVDATTVFPIPYDLDASGLVNAPYAAPPDQLKVRSIRQRLYRGFCFHNNEVPATLDRFRENRQEIMDLFTDNEVLTAKGKDKSKRYLADFYKSVDSPDKIRKNLTDKCRG